MSVVKKQGQVATCLEGHQTSTRFHSLVAAIDLC